MAHTSQHPLNSPSAILQGEKQMIVITDRAREVAELLRKENALRWDFSELHEADRESYDPGVIDEMQDALAELSEALDAFNHPPAPD